MFFMMMALDTKNILYVPRGSKSANEATKSILE